MGFSHLTQTARYSRLRMMGIRFADEGEQVGDAGDSGTGGGTGAADASQPEWTVPPMWEKALQDIPDVLRGSVIEQIKTSEREAQSAIASARGNDVDPDWRSLATEAKQAGLTPQELIDAHNTTLALQQSMYEDPDGFVDQLKEQIDQMVAAGQLTRRQGAEAKAQADANVSDVLTPEQKELAELRAWREQQDGRWQSLEEQAENEQVQQQADEYGQSFLSSLNAAFDGDEQLKGANNETRQAVGRIAASILDADEDRGGNITFEQAIGEGLRQLRQSASVFGAPAAPQQQAAGFPVGGGNNNQAAPTAPKFETDEDRTSAMMAAAQAMLASGN